MHLEYFYSQTDAVKCSYWLLWQNSSTEIGIDIQVYESTKEYFFHYSLHSFWKRGKTMIWPTEQNMYVITGTLLVPSLSNMNSTKMTKFSRQLIVLWWLFYWAFIDSFLSYAVSFLSHSLIAPSIFVSVDFQCKKPNQNFHGERNERIFLYLVWDILDLHQVAMSHILLVIIVEIVYDQLLICSQNYIKLRIINRI